MPEKKFNPNYSEPSTQYTSKYPFSSIIFPENVPVMGADLNELQAIFSKRIADMFVKTLCSNKASDYSANTNGYWIPISQSIDGDNISAYGYYIDPSCTGAYNVKVTSAKSYVKGEGICLKAKPVTYSGEDDASETLVTSIPSNDLKGKGTPETLINYLNDNDFDESVNRRVGYEFSLVASGDASGDGANYILIYSESNGWYIPSYISMFDNSKSQNDFLNLYNFTNKPTFCVKSQVEEYRKKITATVSYKSDEQCWVLNYDIPAECWAVRKQDVFSLEKSGTVKVAVGDYAAVVVDLSGKISVVTDSTGLPQGAIDHSENWLVLMYLKHVDSSESGYVLKILPDYVPYHSGADSGEKNIVYTTDYDSLFNDSMLPAAFLDLFKIKFPIMKSNGDKLYLYDSNGNISEIGGNMKRLEQVISVYTDNWLQAEHSTNSDDTITVCGIKIPCGTWYYKIEISSDDITKDASLVTDIALDEALIADKGAIDAMVEAYQSIVRITTGEENGKLYAVLIAYDEKPDINFNIRFLWLYNI